MKNTLNDLTLAMLLCSAMIITTASYAQVGGVAGAPAPGNGAGNVGVTPVPPTASQRVRNDATPLAPPTPSTVGETNGSPLSQNARANSGTVSNGISANGDINSGDLANNAGSVNRSSQTSAGKMARRAQANAGTAAHAAEVETTRQLNQQQGSMSNAASTQR